MILNRVFRPGHKYTTHVKENSSYLIPINLRSNPKNIVLVLTNLFTKLLYTRHLGSPVGAHPTSKTYSTYRKTSYYGRRRHQNQNHQPGGVTYRSSYFGQSDWWRSEYEEFMTSIPRRGLQKFTFTNIRLTFNSQHRG